MKFMRLMVTTAALTGLILVQLAASAFADSQEKILVVNIVGGAVAGSDRVLRVTQGDKVRLRWVTDKKIILHLHGYDIETVVNPGEITEMVLQANAAGRFPIFVHKNVGGGKASHTHELPLAQLEVHPR